MYELKNIFTDAGFKPGIHMEFEYNYFDSYYMENKGGSSS
jgi:hypothetical protein